MTVQHIFSLLLIIVKNGRRFPYKLNLIFFHTGGQIFQAMKIEGHVYNQMPELGLLRYVIP